MTVEQVRHTRRKAVTLVIALVALVGIQIAYTGWVVARTERKFCAIVGATVDGYRAAPPVSEVGKTQQANAERLYRDLGCGS